jgi:hypothetical protein
MGSFSGVDRKDVVATIQSTTKEILQARQAQALTAAQSAVEEPVYPIADIFGRCFLRVCFWVDVFSGLRRTRTAASTGFPPIQPAVLKKPELARGTAVSGGQNLP